MITNKTEPVWLKTFKEALDYLIVLFTILGTQSVYNNSTDREFHILPICAALLALRVVLSPVVFRKEHLKKLLLFAGPWTAYILIYAAVGGGDRVKLIEKFVVVLILYVVWFYDNFLKGTVKDMLIYYVRVIFVIALISVFMWVTASALKWFPASGPFNIYWGKERRIWNFYYLYFHWQNDFFIHGHRFYRNIGVFTEAPMFSLHLTTALMIDVLLNTRKSRFRYFRIVWLCGTILTTFSVTGYLFMMVVIGVDIYATLIARAMSPDPAVKKQAQRLLVVVVALTGVLGVVGYGLVADKLASRSGGSRMEDYSNGYKGWKDNVWFGAGFGDIEARQRYASWRRLHRSESGFTNSPMAVLCEGGIWFFLCYYVPFAYDIIAALNRRDWRVIFAVGLFVYIFFTTTMEHTCLMLAFLGLSFAHMLVGGHREDSPLLGRPLTIPQGALAPEKEEETA